MIDRKEEWPLYFHVTEHAQLSDGARARYGQPFHTTLCLMASFRPEVLTQELQNLITDIRSVDPNVAPAWFVAAQAAQAEQMTQIQAQIQGVQTEMQAQIQGVQAQMQAQMHEMYTGLQAQLQSMEDRTSAKITNSAANRQENILQSFPNNAGVVYAHFPATLEALNDMNNALAAGFLNHYGQVVPQSNNARKNAIKRFIGCGV